MTGPGLQGFVDAMSQLGFEATLEDGLVICRVTPVDGAHAGESIEAGVAVDELNLWPQAPPHWIHLRADIKFSRTNCRPSPRSGCAMHSRNVAAWGDAEPGIGWSSHVRAVLGEATQ